MNEYLCFVGHVFNREQIDDLRRAIREALAEWEFIRLWFADDHLSGGHIFDKIRESIDRSFFCIFELSDATRPNVFLELGYALGKGKPCVFLLRDGKTMPSDLEGYDRIQYESMVQLANRLRDSMPQIIGRLANVYPTTTLASIDGSLLLSVTELLQSIGPQLSAVVEEAGKKGLSEKQVREAFDTLEKINVLKRVGTRWTFTDQRDKLPRFIESLRKTTRR